MQHSHHPPEHQSTGKKRELGGREPLGESPSLMQHSGLCLRIPTQTRSKATYATSPTSLKVATEAPLCDSLLPWLSSLKAGALFNGEDQMLECIKVLRKLRGKRKVVYCTNLFYLLANKESKVHF